MDTLDAFMLGYASMGDPVRSFDWDKAASILAEKRPDRAYAGLAFDLEYTCGCIWQGGMPLLDARDADSGSEYGTQDTYLASTWALPVLLVDGKVVPCWRYKGETGWGPETRWPESALEIVWGETVCVP